MSSLHVFFNFIITTTIFSTVLPVDIPLGSTISASDTYPTWTSPDSNFSFMFILDPSGASSAHFAAIIYDKNKDIAIWIAGATSSNGGAADSTASLSLQQNGNLELRNGSSNSLVWQSSTSGRGISSAALDNSGNFVLKNDTVSNIWSTFENPTDTIVPSQNFTKSSVLNNGFYLFNLSGNGNLTLLWNDTIIYYNSGLNSSATSNLSSPSLSILPIGIITLSDPQLLSPLNLVYSSDYAESGNILRFVKLDNDGNLRIYSYTKGSGNKTIKWSAVADQCRVFGYCGNMGICSYNDSGPVCGCPSQNFEPIDARDSRKGCKRKMDLSNCRGNVTMLSLDHTVLLTYAPEFSQVFFIGFQACRANCLLINPCQGSSSLADGMGFCYQKTSSFISGYQSPAIPSTSFVKICGQDVIPLGSNLSASNPNSSWTSSDGTFTLTFISDPSGASAAYFAAIIYDKNPDIAIWIAGATSSNGGAADSNASLSLRQNGNLELRNGSSKSLVWQSSTSGRGISFAALDNSGNFVLKNGTGSNIWSTFENPTDTIVPSQNFTKSSVLNNGFYLFNLSGNGNLTLLWNDTIIYYNSGVNSSATSNLSSPSLSILPIGIITLSDPQLLNPLSLCYSSDYAESGNILRFVKLDNDGNLRIYSYTKGSGSKTITWSAVADQCRVFGYCGNMGICSYNDTGPVCGCPSQNFERVDARDSRKGCKRKVDLSNCQGNGTMLLLDHTVLLTYPPEWNGGNSQVLSTGFEACRTNCLLTNPCQGSSSLADGTGFCYQKTSSFISGYQSPAIPSTSFVKICGQAEPNPPVNSAEFLQKDSWRLKPWIVVVVVVLVTIFGLILLEGSLWLWCFRDSTKFGGLSAHYSLLEYAFGAPVQFSYRELQRATKVFKDKLGEGGFGAVYKGILANRTIAGVKQLEGIEQGEKQFRMEVATISSTHHLNLVRLIGFCSEGRHRLLVYEFMKNGSLDKFLFSSEEKSQKMLNWESRYNIALGTARGITYLHEECRDCIVHCDIKPENILLDENYNAIVSDFGLAKLINPRDHRYRTLTSVRGTGGYLAPEWLANLPITSKSDVYSYGMVLLEIVSGKRNFDVSVETSNKRFSIWAYEEFDKGNAVAIVDPRLSRNDIDMEQVMRAIKVSFWCIQEQPSHRPLMGKVVQMLEGITEIGKPTVPKLVTEGSVCGTSMTASSISAFSTIAASAPVPSSS